MVWWCPLVLVSFGWCSDKGEKDVSHFLSLSFQLKINPLASYPQNEKKCVEKKEFASWAPFLWDGSRAVKKEYDCDAAAAWEWKLSKQERLCWETKKKDPRFMRLLTINSATEDGDILCCCCSYSTGKILMLLQERQKLELQKSTKPSLMVNEKLKNSVKNSSLQKSSRAYFINENFSTVGVFALGNMLDMAFKLNWNCPPALCQSNVIVTHLLNKLCSQLWNSL